MGRSTLDRPIQREQGATTCNASMFFIVLTATVIMGATGRIYGKENVLTVKKEDQENYCVATNPTGGHKGSPGVGQGFGLAVLVAVQGGWWLRVVFTGMFGLPLDASVIPSLP